MFKRIKRYLKDPYYALGNDMIKKCPNRMSDKFYLSVLWKSVMGYELDWKHPKTFNEKLQWLKLYDRNPLYTTLVDKVEVKKWVANKVGEEYVIPTLAVYNSVDEIDLDKLPNRFVLKCNHDSGSVVICRDKSEFDFEAAKRKLDACVKHDFYWDTREWAYKNVKRCILAEQYLDPEPDTKDLVDYKWFCFGGEPRFCQVIRDRSTNETIDFFDVEWHHQDFVGLVDVNVDVKMAATLPACPSDLDTQVRIARQLSKDIPYSRIDLYETDDRTYFGEITFYPLGGLGSFKPKEYNEVLGKMLVLPGEKRGG